MTKVQHIENEYFKHYWFTQIIHTWHLGIVLYRGGSWLFLLLPQFRHSSSFPWPLQHFLTDPFSSSKYIIYMTEKVICKTIKLNHIAPRLNNHLWFPAGYSAYIYDGPPHSSFPIIQLHRTSHHTLLFMSWSLIPPLFAHAFYSAWKVIAMSSSNIVLI